QRNRGGYHRVRRKCVCGGQRVQWHLLCRKILEERCTNCLERWYSSRRCNLHLYRRNRRIGGGKWNIWLPILEKWRTGAAVPRGYRRSVYGWHLRVWWQCPCRRGWISYTGCCVLLEKR